MDPQFDKTPADAAQPAMAQVLFMDVVAYGRLDMREQLGVSYQLTDLVRNTSQYRSGEGKDTVLCRPTGDGMAVVFFADLAAPIRCAIEINANVKKQALIRLRMGIHSGPIYRTTDINKQADVAGDAIIMAQRVMDAGDADHILLSRAMAEILLPLGEWNDYIAEVGPVEIKHGGQIFLYNFSGSDFGNPDPPSKAAAKSETSADSKKTRSATARTAIKTQTVENPYKYSPQEINALGKGPRDCWNCGMLLVYESSSCIHCGAKTF